MLLQSFKFAYGLAIVLLLAVNFALLPGPVAADGAATEQAFILPMNVKWSTAHYDTTTPAANFLGCWGPPKDCMMLVVASWDVTLAPDGFHPGLN